MSKARARARKRYIAHLMRYPWSRRARRSRILRQHLDAHGQITPHFAWSEMADTGGVPVPARLRPNAIRHCWQLERFRRRLAKKANQRKRTFSGIHIDGPYRTPAHNVAVGGAKYSQHMNACATDHFVTQVRRWQAETGLSQAEVVAIANSIFRGLGNETSGTLHLDSRTGPRARFVTWGR